MLLTIATNVLAVFKAGIICPDVNPETIELVVPFGLVVDDPADNAPQVAPNSAGGIPDGVSISRIDASSISVGNRQSLYPA